MKSVNELCKQIKGIYNVDGNANTMITGISSDSRTIEKGDLFVCFSGVHTDGSVYASQAVEKGAVAVLTTKHLDLPGSAVQIMVPDVPGIVGVGPETPYFPVRPLGHNFHLLHQKKLPFQAAFFPSAADH
jgi:UDP-N-acetylmuramyl tripeptide synthase